LLDYYENNSQTVPVISKQLITNSMKVVCGEKMEKRGKPPKKETIEMKDKLIAFYNHHYLPLTQNEPIVYTGLSNGIYYRRCYYDV